MDGWAGAWNGIGSGWMVGHCVALLQAFDFVIWTFWLTSWRWMDGWWDTDRNGT